jgi:hypothetical protein
LEENPMELMINKEKLVRPEILLSNEDDYASSMRELGFYFIKKYPQFFRRLNKDDNDQFSLRVSPNKSFPPIERGEEKDLSFIETVCKTIFVGWKSDQYDSHITIQITKNSHISISFMHKINWKDQVTIYFSDHSLGEMKIPGQKEESYDPAVLNQSARKFFMETIGFASERTTTIKDGLDTLEKVLQRLEDLIEVGRL